MSNYQLTQEELEAQLTRQLRFLESSIDSFDRGLEDEAIRMAVVARVLLHDTAKSTSLFAHLQRKDFSFVDTSWSRQSGSSYYGLTFRGVLADGRGHVYPTLDQNYSETRKLAFDDWWNGPVIADFEGNVITRSELILIMANKDGGAHVDLNLSGAYAALSRAGSMQTVTMVDGKWKRMPGPEYATMRQIAHEIMKSIVPSYTKNLVTPANTLVVGQMRIEVGPIT